MTTTPLQLYEVIRWGNDSDNIYSGGPNGPDTCFLVHAESVEQAAAIVDAELVRSPAKRVENWAGAIFLLGTDQRSTYGARIVRGPYIQHAYYYGWRHWYRNYQDHPWEEKTDS